MASIAQILTDKYEFNEPTAHAYAQSNGKCIYCCIDLMSDFVLYFNSQIDHIYPKSKYKDLEWCNNNNVLSCYYCNKKKRDFDPSTINEEYASNIKNILQTETIRQKLIRDISLILDLSEINTIKQFEKDKVVFQEIINIFSGQ